MTHEPARSDQPEYVRDHSRLWETHRYVYPVISRRGGGLSVGVNLSPDQRCTFACVYCQVRRDQKPPAGPIDLDTLARELDALCRQAVSGELWRHPRFRAVEPARRVLRDIALSGDGEPTASPVFEQAVRIAAETLDRLELPDVRIVVITNATLLHTRPVERALAILAEHRGEIWAKLDAGTDDRLEAINRPTVDIDLDRIVANIARIAARLPVIVQTMLCRMADQPPPPDEIDAYADRLRQIAAAGSIARVQLYTVARPPAEAFVGALSSDQLEQIARRIRDALPGVPVETFA